MSSQSTIPLRIGLLQFTPTHSQPDVSAVKAQSLLDKVSPRSVDLLVAPEMCLTGYVFRDLDHVKGMCEDAKEDQGATIRLAKGASRRIECYSLMGFPEVEPPRLSSQPVQASRPFDARPKAEQTQPSAQESRSGPHYYNSAILTSPSGTPLHTFRKHFLFNDDERWCEAGAGFQYIDIPLTPSSTIRVAVGICMDINPYQFKSDFELYEFASWCVDHQVDMVVLPMAWLCSTDTGKGEAEEPHLDVVNYWAARFAPLMERGEQGNKVILIACNRTGTEGGEYCVAT